MRMLLALLAITTSPALAQPTEIPRTRDGRPDLQGYWGGEFITPLERPDGFTALIIPADQAAEAVKEMAPEIEEVVDPEIHLNPFPTNLLQMNGEFRSSMIIEPADGKLPFTALAEAAIDQFERSFDGPEDRPGSERCIDGLIHPPLRTVSMLIPLQVVQTPDALMLQMEDIDPGRVVRLGGAPMPDAIRTLAGESRGSWDGDTLVITTDHFAVTHPTGIQWRDAALITEDSRTIERFRLLSANQLSYQFTVEDPSLYKRPWLAESMLVRTPRPVYEYACHEANISMFHILTAARLGKQDEEDAN